MFASTHVSHFDSLRIGLAGIGMRVAVTDAHQVFLHGTNLWHGLAGALGLHAHVFLGGAVVFLASARRESSVVYPPDLMQCVIICCIGAGKEVDSFNGDVRGSRKS